MYKSFKFKNIAILAFSAFSFFSSFSSFASFAEARWVDISIEKERENALKHIKEIEVNPNTENILVDNDILRIQKELVEANPHRLWFNDSKHNYYLKPIKKLVTYEKKYQTYNVGDGYIFIDARTIFKDNGLGYEHNNIDNIHNNSAVAFTIGHEMAHWEQNLKFYASEQESRIAENDADKKSIEYSEKTLAYSYGGGLISFFYDNLDDLNKEDKEHDAPIKRYQNISNYITKASNNRIKISTNGNVRYDGKPIFNIEKNEWVPSYNNDYKSGEETFYSRERTMYVAGQIAFAIKYNVWNRESIDIFTQDTLFNNRSNRIVLVTKNPLSGEYKIIDKFNITPERFQEIFARFLASDNDFINKSCNLEEKYCLQLLAYVYINK